MKVNEFIGWLKTIDQEAVVHILIETTDRYGYSFVSTERFDPSETCTHWEYTNFKGNSFVTQEKPWYNTSQLQLGGKE